MRHNNLENHFLNGFWPCLIALTAIGLILTTVKAQECPTAKTLKEKTAAKTTRETLAATALAEFNKLKPLGAKPAAGADVAAAKTAADNANDKRIKAIEKLKEEEGKLGGSTPASLRQDIQSKQRDIEAKLDEKAAKDKSSYIANKDAIVAKEKEILGLVNDTDLKIARSKVSDTSYKEFDTSNSQKLEKCAEDKAAIHGKGFDYEKECAAEFAQKLLDFKAYKSPRITELSEKLQASITAINATGRTTTDKKVSDKDEILNNAPELLKEIARLQNSAQSAFKELDSLDSGGLSQLDREIQSLRNDKKAMEAKLKPITDAENEVKTTKEAHDKAKMKKEEAETSSEKLKAWETAKSEYTTKESKKNTTANDVTTAETERATAETEDNKFQAEAKAAITKARTAAAADKANLQTWRATVNPTLMEKARTDTFNSGIFKRERTEQTLKLKQAKTKAAQDAIRAEWSTISAARVQERYIGLRNEEKALSLEAVRDDAVLVKYKCFKDVEEFRNKLSEVANKIRKLKASVGTGADFEFEGEDEKENIDVGPIPPLDEDGIGEEPTDEVPDDITTGTGQVKVNQYFVFLLTNSSNGLYVGSEDSLKGTTRCSWVGGGIGCKPTDVVTYRKLAGPFASQTEAQQALCQNITESRIFPIGIGLKGRWQGGQWYGLWNAGLSGCTK